MCTVWMSLSTGRCLWRLLANKSTDVQYLYLQYMACYLITVLIVYRVHSIVHGQYTAGVDVLFFLVFVFFVFWNEQLFFLSWTSKIGRACTTWSGHYDRYTRMLFITIHMIHSVRVGWIVLGYGFMDWWIDGVQIRQARPDRPRVDQGTRDKGKERQSAYE